MDKKKTGVTYIATHNGKEIEVYYISQRGTYCLLSDCKTEYKENELTILRENNGK